MPTVISTASLVLRFVMLHLTTRWTALRETDCEGTGMGELRETDCEDTSLGELGETDYEGTGLSKL
jgi:hypothetical protein